MVLIRVMILGYSVLLLWMIFSLIYGVLNSLCVIWVVVMVLCMEWYLVVLGRIGRFRLWISVWKFCFVFVLWCRLMVMMFVLLVVKVFVMIWGEG